MHHGILCGMAAFKQHCNVILWKASLVIGDGANQAGGPLRDITKVSDLPSDKTLIGWIRQAAKLNEDGVKVPEEPRKLLIFRIFAARAAAELARLHLEWELRASEERLRDL